MHFQYRPDNFSNAEPWFKWSLNSFPKSEGVLQEFETKQPVAILSQRGNKLLYWRISVTIYLSAYIFLVLFFVIGHLLLYSTDIAKRCHRWVQTQALPIGKFS